jgi:DNA-binding protein YbaB
MLKRRMEETEYQLAAYAAALADVTDELPEQTIRREIEPGLGVVEVDGAGGLLDIRLDPKAVATSDAVAFADRVLVALRQAEAEAHAVHMERLRRAARFAPPNDHC